jgi:branched-chain amino acid aminotransferase
MAKIEANMSGVDEALCMSADGSIAEGVGENIFLIKDGKIYTPPTSTGALPGITAKSVVAVAEKLGYPVTVTKLTMFQLFNADELFFTGTAAEIVPIRQVNWRQVGKGEAGPITKMLAAEFKKYIQDPKNGVPI